MKSRQRSIRSTAVDPARYRGQVWVTRPRPGVDRMSSAWLIRRFIDPDATFCQTLLAQGIAMFEALYRSYSGPQPARVSRRHKRTGRRPARNGSGSKGPQSTKTKNTKARGR